MTVSFHILKADLNITLIVNVL